MAEVVIEARDDRSTGLTPVPERPLGPPRETALAPAMSPDRLLDELQEMRQSNAEQLAQVLTQMNAILGIVRQTHADSST